MSDYHVLQANKLKTKITVAMHYPVPDEANFAGKTLVSCIVEDDFVTKRTHLPLTHIAQAEIDQVEAGEVIEDRLEFGFLPDLSDAQIRDQMDINYANRLALAIDTIRARYAFWGYSRDIP